MTTYTITKKFKTSVERTPRVLEIAEGFGLGLSDGEFVVYDGLKIDIEPGDVVYITGQSGSGKSLLLCDLKSQMRNVADIETVNLEEKPLVDQVGKTMGDASRILSLAGINDAYLMIRKPSELSDGQRYRLKLAKLIAADDADVWTADEFGAVLDRTTAKVVALNMQKIARKLGKTLIVATTHTDLVKELGPNLVVRKRFHDRITMERPNE